MIEWKRDGVIEQNVIISDKKYTTFYICFTFSEALIFAHNLI
jgi:hypothetical protein